MGTLRRKYNRWLEALIPGGLVAVCLAAGVLLEIAFRHPKPDPALRRQVATQDTLWLAAAQLSLEKEEYLPKRVLAAQQDPDHGEPSFVLTNRAHGVRSFVGPDGWEVAPRSAEERSTWQWRYRFASVKRGASARRVGAPRVHERDGAIHLSYTKDITEWYRNSRSGIEQGFEIKERPYPAATGELVLEGDVVTDLEARQRDPGSIAFTRGKDELFVYMGLKVFDAKGRELPSWLSSEGRSSIRIHIDDSRARYPVIVDPTLASASWSGEGNSALAFYGSSVASAGDVNGDGYSDVLVGAPSYDNGEAYEGRAYLYLGSASGLAIRPSWVKEGNQASANYGASVASAGDVNGDGYSDVIVGAWTYENGEAQEGKASVYLGSPSGLAATASWTGECNAANCFYGQSVSTAGDVNGDSYSDVLVGASNSTYLYFGSASGLVGTAAWIGGTAQSDAGYGSSVSAAGDVNGDGFADIVVGASLYDNGQLNQGAAYLYLGSASGLASTAAWSAESNQAQSEFGGSVSCAGDVNGDGYSDVVVGARWYSNTATQDGKAFLYLGSASGLATVASWAASTGRPDSSFGVSVASAGDVNGDSYSDVIVGASRYGNGQSLEGAVFLYFGGATGLSTTANWIAESNRIGAQLGNAVSGAGNVNGDAYPDFVVGAPAFENGQSFEGGAFLYSLAPPTATPTPTPPAATPTPVGISPGQNVVPPRLYFKGGTVIVKMPRFRPVLKGKALEDAIQVLIRNGLSRAGAQRAVKSLEVKYVVKIQYVSDSGSAARGAPFEDDAGPLGSRGGQYTSRNNQLSVRNLSPGNYSASYSVIISTRNPPVNVGSSNSSRPRSFTVR